MTTEEFMRWLGAEPDRFEDINRSIEGFDCPRSDESDPKAAETTSPLTQQTEQGHQTKNVPTAFAQIVHSCEQPCMLVSATGFIKALNTKAAVAFDVNVNDHIDEHHAFRSGTEWLSCHVAESTKNNRLNGGMSFCCLIDETTSRILTFAIFPTNYVDDTKNKSALICQIDPRWTQSIRKYLAGVYGLTNAEIDILTLFLDGITIAEVAKTRKRALSTIRTQFQTILNKCGMQSQAHLMRHLIMSFSFADQNFRLEKAASHPYRQEFQMLRPKGRSVDLLISGDKTGELVIFLTAPCMHGFSHRIESKFMRAGLCVVSLARPGYGRTSMPAEGQEIGACLADDVEAVLKQLEMPNTTLVTSRNSFVPALDVAIRKPNLVRNVLSLNTQPPKRFFDQCDCKFGSPVMRSICASHEASPAMFERAVNSALRACAALGTKDYLDIAHTKNAAINNDHVAEEIQSIFEDGLRKATMQGNTAVISDFKMLLTDWTNMLELCMMPIVMLHGTKNATYPIEPVRALRARFPNTLSLIELPYDRGNLFLFDTDAVVKQLEVMTKNQ